jgi:hypothetical protein
MRHKIVPPEPLYTANPLKAREHFPSRLRVVRRMTIVLVGVFVLYVKR